MNVILIHGAWHGPWVWESVVPVLTRFVNVIAPAMPGRAFEVSRAYQKIDLMDYVATVEACIATLTGPIILVGHSLAGLTISQVAENHPDKIKALVYLTAFVSSDGETMTEMTGKLKTPGIATELQFEPKHNKIDIALSQRTQSLFYHRCQPEAAQHALQALNPEPLKAFTTPVHLTPERFGQVEKIYIKCIDDQALLLADQNNMIQKSNFQKIYTLEADHSPFMSDPNGLIDILTKIAYQF